MSTWSRTISRISTSRRTTSARVKTFLSKYIWLLSFLVLVEQNVCIFYMTILVLMGIRVRYLISKVLVEQNVCIFYMIILVLMGMRLRYLIIKVFL